MEFSGCQLCNSIGVIIVKERNNPYQIIGYAFQCTCPIGKKNFSLLPLWSNFHWNHYESIDVMKIKSKDYRPFTEEQQRLNIGDTI